MRLVQNWKVDGNELYIFGSDPKINKNLISPGFIIYRGNPDEDVRKKSETAFRFVWVATLCIWDARY